MSLVVVVVAAAAAVEAAVGSVERQGLTVSSVELQRGSLPKAERSNS